MCFENPNLELIGLEIYLDAGMRSLPSSRCISLFSRRLLSTGSTFRSAFSIPSSTSTRPSDAAFTAL